MKQNFQRILVLAASLKEANLFSSLLSQEKMIYYKCKSFAELVEQMDQGVGALLISKEALDSDSILTLSRKLKKQASWSHLPVVVLVSPVELQAQNETTVKLIKSLRNVNLLERPVKSGALLSVMQAILTDRKRQYKVRDLLAELEISKKEAVTANEAKSAFLANMSHEIRTPLGAILGFSELLAEDSQLERQHYLETIRRNGNLLRTLVDDILDLAKVESPHFETEVIEISLNQLISEIVDLFEPKTSAKNLGFMIQFDPADSDLIETDPIRLKQILINILGNAIKFTSVGCISMKVRFADVMGHPDKTRVILEVSDTGIGITDAQAKKLFKPFTQADDSMTRQYGGTGLGLVLSKKIAAALGGNVRLLESQLGHGSTFEISIVAGKVKQAQIAAIRGPKKDMSRSLSHLRILVVDDSKDNQFLISRILRNSGAKVDTADDGLFGMQEALTNFYDLVLMDVQMPRLGGLEATSQLRKKHFIKPIIALTANALKGDREKCLEAGCNDYLTKPIQKNELIRRIALLGTPQLPAI